LEEKTRTEPPLHKEMKSFARRLKTGYRLHMSLAKLIYDSSHNADLLYITGFDCHDAFLFLEDKKQKIIFMSDLEIDRAKANAKVDKVHSWSEVAKTLPATKRNVANIIAAILAERKIKHISMHPKTPFALVDALRKLKLKVEAGSSPFYPERVQKTEKEKQHILKSQQAVFKAIRHAENILKQSKISNGKIIFNGKALTSEFLRTQIAQKLLELGCASPFPAIVACGKQACDPHEIGHGVLKAHQSIIVDVFPRSISSHFYGDATRTFCKGRAPDALQALYTTVKSAQEMAIKEIKAGKNGTQIHQNIQKLFTVKGYGTEKKHGRMQGFFHGTGHSIGLELHEEPARINTSDYTLKKGNVLSVEPGLYYPDIGGVRIEDLVFVTQSGCEVLGKYPKKLEIL
ncbi:MAG: aminopeptidase P family protein, partial [Deltaproteobacteria bacterium CG_4_9_14_0_2_um_filter_42_21]